MTSVPSNPTNTERPRIAILRKGGGGLLSWCEDLETGFREAGAEARVISLRGASMAERIEQARGGGRLFENRLTRSRVADELRNFSPDLLVVMNYPGMPARANEEFRAAMHSDVPVVAWLCDRVETLPHGFEANLNGVYYFDTICEKPLEDAYASQTTTLAYLPLAVCPKRFLSNDIDLSGRIAHPAFVGCCTPPRKKVLDDYRSAGGKIDVYGPHAGNFLRFWRNGRLSCSTMAEIYQKHLVCFNMLQPGNTTRGLNMRAFEIPCAGGLASYPNVPDLKRCFVPGEEVLVYDSLEELIEKINALANNLERAREITLAGHRRVLDEHTFFHRARTILNDWLPGSPEISG